MASLQIDLSDSDLSLVNMTAGNHEAASPSGGGGSPASDDDDETVTVRSDDYDEIPSRSASVSRSVTFGQTTSLRSMRPIPDKQRSRSMIESIESQGAIEAAREAGLSRHHVSERRPTDRAGNLSGPGSEVETPVATPVAAADGLALALAAARDPKVIKGVLRSSLRTGPEAPRPAPALARRFRLSTRSQQYDLDGDGVLNEEERAMMERDRDLNRRDREAERTAGGAPKASERPGTSASRPKLNQLRGGRSGAPASSEAETPARRPRLTTISRRYDLDGDGVLDAIEQAMRDRDVNNDGQLDNREVHNIIQDRLRSEEDYGLYKRVAMTLTCLVFILALSNFGTSWASAILAKDTSADGETGTIVTKRTGEAVGLQGTSHVVDIEPLSDDEFEQRRLLVDAEMAEDPDHPDHAHRRLGRNKNRNNKCQCNKMGYDQGRVKERDLMKLVDKCDGARTVIARRTWKNGDIMDTAISVDYDTICAPGTKVKRKGKKKNNKNKTKTKVIDSYVEFLSKGKDGKDKSITFDCEKGECFASGNLVHQRAGHPCRIERDFSGASECENGLACYDSDDHQARRGRGLCTELREKARRGQICDMRHSVNACEGNLICYPTGGKGRNAKISAGTVATGTCQPAVKFAELDEVCGVALGDDACADGFRCLGANGSKIRRGIGLCAATTARFAKRNKVCSTKFGLDACEDHHACFSRNGDIFDTGRGRTRICQFVRRNAGLEEVCDFSYGAAACDADYECFGENGCDYEEGFGLCRRTNDGGGRGGAIVKFAKRNKACDIDRFGLDACESDRACFARNGNFFDTRGRTRICQDVRPRAGRDGVCNVFFGDNACAAAGYECRGKNGRSIQTGFGVCQDVGGGSGIVEFARAGQACNMDYRNACVADHACYPWKGDFFYSGRDRTGICQAVRRNAGLGGVCSVSNRLGACAGGLQCLGNNGRSIQSGFGVCQSTIVEFARAGEECNMDYRNACVANHACYPWKGDFFYSGRDRTGICQFVGRNVGVGGACDVSNNLGACAAGLRCLGNNGRSIQSGFGVCQDVGGASRTNSGGRSGGCSGSGACLPAGASLAMDCTDSCSCLSGTCMKYCNPGSDRWFCY